MTDLPTTMRAVVTTGHGGFEVLSYRTNWPVPTPAPHQVLIKVAACGMNNTDVNTRSGWYSKEVTEATTGDAFDSVNEGDSTWGGAGISFPRIQGADVCGTVVAAGAEADPALIGQRVITDNWLRDWDDPMNMEKTGYFGSEADGGYAEYAVADHRNVGAVHCDWSDAELATISCSYTTAEGMLARAQVGPGDRVLITGASGGVGSAALQLARCRGATVIAMSSPAKAEEVKALGAEQVVDRNADLKATLGEGSVDVVVDLVAGPQWPSFLEVLRRGGRYVTAGAIAGPITELDVRTLYLKDLSLFGATYQRDGVFANLIALIEAGKIRPLVSATYHAARRPEDQPHHG